MVGGATGTDAVSAIVEFAVQPAEIALARAFEGREPEVRSASVQRVGPGLRAGFLVHAADEPPVGDDASPTVESVGRVGDRVLYRTTWEPGPDSLLATVADHDGEVVDVAAGDAWTLRVRFPDDDAVPAFRADCEARGIDLGDVVVFGPTAGLTEDALTSAQLEVLALALEAGYFEVPRDATLADLADELDVSDQAVSERLRRGLRRLSAEALSTVDRDPGSDG